MPNWTQVYIKGLTESIDPTDEQLEELLDARFELSSLPELAWAGPGSTVVKRSEKGVCRGYAFVSFFSAEGATKAVELMNQHQNLHPYTTAGQCQAKEENEGELKYDNDVTPQPVDTSTGDTIATTIDESSLLLPLQLQAELCKPKPKAKSKKKKKQTQPQQDYSDLRLRRQRGAPVRKHPVITNSDGTRTGLGNKTK